MHFWHKSIHFSNIYPIYKTLTLKRGKGHPKRFMSLIYNNDIYMKVWFIGIYWLNTYPIFRKIFTLIMLFFDILQVTKTR